MIANDARVLLHLLRGQPRRGSQAERPARRVYAPRQSRYDASVNAPVDVTDGRLCRCGGGIGSGDRAEICCSSAIASRTLTYSWSTCPALLEQARRRTANMDNVRVVDADVVSWRPERPVDVVYLSYS